ncbi:HIT-like domain-containing protein [Xylariaceae sp. FL0594]|nr:HIT-like domain-containing protein [Xylariaceae sp. FL0594]
MLRAHAISVTKPELLSSSPTSYHFCPAFKRRIMRITVVRGARPIISTTTTTSPRSNLALSPVTSIAAHPPPYLSQLASSASVYSSRSRRIMSTNNSTKNSINSSHAAAASNGVDGVNGGSSSSSAKNGDGNVNDKDRIRFGPFDVTTQVFLTTPHSFALVNLKPLLPGHVLVCPRAPHQRLTELSVVELQDLFRAVQRVERMLAQYYFASQEEEGDWGEHDDDDDEGESKSKSTDGERLKEIKSRARARATPEAGSFNIAIQDGAEAGQTVPHVHVHVIPRIRGSTAKDSSTEGDAIYESMADEAGNVGGALWDREIIVARKMGERPRPGGGFPRIEDQARVGRSMEEMEKEAAIYKKVLATMREDDEDGDAAEGEKAEI